jgi:hypothetical protein
VEVLFEVVDPFLDGLYFAPDQFVGVLRKCQKDPLRREERLEPAFVSTTEVLCSTIHGENPH